VVTLAVTGTSIAMYWRGHLFVDPLEAKDVKFLVDVTKLSPTLAWDVWVKQFRDYELSGRQEPIHISNRKFAKKLLISSVVGSCLAVLGVVAMVAAVFMKPLGR
jgi:hypothetical protein